MPTGKPAAGINVCHVTSAHSRYDVRIFHKECRSLANAGYDVTLLVNDSLPDERLDGIQIRSTHFQPANRFERMVVSRRRIARNAIAIDADIYHFHDPELIPLASKMKRRGKQVIFDFHEDVASQILYKTWIPAPLRRAASRFYRWYQDSGARKYDALITVTPKFVDNLSKINPATYMVTNYPMLTPPEDFIPAEKSDSVCFAGGLLLQWNHANIIRAVERTGHVRYILAGSGPKEYISGLQSLTGWSMVDYRGRIPHGEVQRIYAESKAGMTLLSYDSQVGDEGTLGNTKIFEFMNASLPIICSDNRLWKAIVEEYQCGIAVDPGDVGAIAEAIERLVSDPQLADRMGRSGRRAVEEVYNWETQEKVLADVYAKVAAGLDRGFR